VEGTARARSDPTSASYDIEREFATLVATNPWPRVPLAPPYVLTEDAAAVRSFALTVLPGPWSGPVLTARVLLLLANPSYEQDRDEADLQHRDLRVLYRSQLSGLAPFPWHLERWRWSGAGEYWHPLLRRLVEAVGPSAVATDFATVQLVAYHSAEYIRPAGVLRTQPYSLQVVRHALARGSLVVVARRRADWMSLVPELAEVGSRVLHLATRRPYLTPGALGTEAFEWVKQALASA